MRWRGRTAEIAAYLERHFAKSNIEIERTDAEDGYRCLVSDDDGEYELIVLDEAVAGPGKDDFEVRLEEYGAANVMRDMVGFPVTVTASGCIFGRLR